MSEADPIPEGAVVREVDGGWHDRLVREEPLLIRVRDQSVLTMRTPGRDEDLAIGFLLTEGVLRDVDEVEGIETEAGDADELRADAVTVAVRNPAAARIEGRLTRTHEIRSSCGICGLVDADELLEDTPPLLSGVPRLEQKRIPKLLKTFSARQKLFAATGACHGAAIFDAAGDVLGFAEDVGRHNALDKAIGEAARAGADLPRSIAMLSGRAGFDLVLKCLRVRIPCIVSVSAASALSHDLCASAGATLVGFARGTDCTVYVDGNRID